MTAAQGVVWLDGEFQPLDEARISPLDRGFLFADGVYELIPVYGGRPFRLDDHLARLAAGIDALRLDGGRRSASLAGLVEELVARNGAGDLSVYVQVTRGAHYPRDHRFPAGQRPTVFAMCSPLAPRPGPDGIAAVTLPDERWARCHLKTIALLPNVLARQRALDRGADDALLIRDGVLTEAAAANVFVARDGELCTPVKDRRILPGITRQVIIELAAEHGIACVQRDIAAGELEVADEVWVTSSLKEIVPVVEVDGRPVGGGRPGPLWRRVTALYEACRGGSHPGAGVLPAETAPR